MEYQPLNSLVDRQRAFFSTGQTRSLEFRYRSLRKLQLGIAGLEKDMLEAMARDLGKPAAEAYSTDIGVVLGDIQYMLKNLKRLAAPGKAKTPLGFLGASAQVRPEPLGVVLIIAPWNYPFHLLLRPLVGALAAGNCAVLKPSELTPCSSALSRRLIESCFEPEYVTLVEGGVEVGQALLEQKYDCIFFTGGTRQGRTVMEAAARNLTPVILELGGKCPCIVEPDANLSRCARSIVWGKFINAGQTCVAPDYLLVNRTIKAALIGELKQAVHSFYGDEPLHSQDYGRVVNEHRFWKLKGWMEQGETVCGGKADLESLYIAPTIIDNISWDDPIMQEEIFGPLLPIIEYENLDQVLDMINARPRPLAIYLFSKNRAVQQRVIEETSSGGLCINDTLSHMLPDQLPFGGVGDSGTGSYHGDSSFYSFSHKKSVFNNSSPWELTVKYPPYRVPLSTFKRLLRFVR
ncbi:MAG: aldehyde dehydrogenase [Syntrophomonas sp.]